MPHLISVENHHHSEHEEPDNTPKDNIQYREYKILLKPDRFISPDVYEAFWKIIRETAKKFDVKITEFENPFVNQIREVLFYDTPHFRLYNNHFIVRLRTLYHNGWPAAVPELTVKFRHPDFEKAAEVNVRPATPGATRIKFKEELLPFHDRLGAMRSVYSHNCVLSLPRVAADVAVKDIAAVFPAFKDIAASEDGKISLVNDVAVEELQANVGMLHFGHGMNGKASVAVWRSRAREIAFCGEFAFQCKFENSNDLHKSSLRRADEFYKAVQLEASDWVLLATTKTALVYGLGSIPTTNVE